MTNLWQIVSCFDVCAAATCPDVTLFVVIYAIGMYDTFASMLIACFEGIRGHAIGAHETLIMP
jgi:hypothetical protein